MLYLFYGVFSDHRINSHHSQPEQTVLISNVELVAMARQHMYTNETSSRPCANAVAHGLITFEVPDSDHKGAGFGNRVDGWI